MRDPLWESKKEKLLHYNRRSPEKQALYRVISSYHQELIGSWEELFQTQYGALRTEVREMPLKPILSVAFWRMAAQTSMHCLQGDAGRLPPFD